MNFYSPPFPPAFSSFLLFKTRVALFGQKLVKKKLSFVDLKHRISTMSASSNGVANGAGGTCKIELKDPELLKTSCFVGGKFVPAAKEDGQGWFDVLNPATGELVAKVADGGKVTTQQAIETAKSAFDSWKKLTALERSAILKKWFDLIIQNAEDLGKIMTTEQGKPLPEAIGEIKYGASFVEFFAEEAKRLYGDIIPAGSETRALVLPQPVGVCGLVTPWNFP
jgi:succinate-semialdehyde dehydrogenase/glutarate-semialdehyde dehydrogenase